MSIADELRELARRKTVTWGTELLAIADRIDEAHETELRDERERCLDWCKGCTLRLRDLWSIDMRVPSEEARRIGGELADENERLRKLAARMWPYAKGCFRLFLMLGRVDAESDDIERELYELGIEVRT